MMSGVGRVSGGLTRARKVEVPKIFKVQVVNFSKVQVAKLFNFTQISIWDRQNPSFQVKYIYFAQASLSI